VKVTKLFHDVCLIKTSKFKDDRGYFSEVFNLEEIRKIGIKNNFIQDNLSFSKNKGTIRGLHFQKEPFAQAKLLRVLSGKIQDVFIDIRKESEKFEQYSSIILTPDDGWIYIPKGYAHGFCTLTDNVEILYKVDNYYSKKNDSGIIWNDSFFNISWDLNNVSPIISNKDNRLAKWIEIKKTL
tara:strand:- start:1586 stop:2131 length:546 start_codon:yes stop_codon:yes gene_type:complete